MGLFKSKGKSGRKERHRAQDQIGLALEEFNDPEGVFRNLFAGSLGQGQDDSGDLFQGGTQLLNRLLPQLEQALAGLQNPGENPLQIGLSAPGILEGLIARNQENIAAQGQSAARSASGFIPSRGGGAERAIGEIFRGGAGDAASMESQLRAQAAQQDLANRLGIIGGIGQGMGFAQNSAGFGLGSGLQLSDFLMDIAGQRSNIRRGLASQLFQQSRDKRSQRNSMNTGIGQGIGQLAGAAGQALMGGFPAGGGSAPIVEQFPGTGSQLS